MKEATEARMIDIELDGVIWFPQTGHRIECVIYGITEDYTEVSVMASDPRILVMGDLELSIILPTERSPVRCAGRITWHSGDHEATSDQDNYPARILITEISRIDQRRLELFIDHKIAFISGGNSRLSM